MIKNDYKQNTCFLCNSLKLSKVLTLKPTPIADEYVTKKFLSIRQPNYPLNLMLCKQCGHVQLQHIIPSEHIYINYIFQTISSPGLVSHFRFYAKDVLARIKPKSNSLIIDLGSNDGTLLKEFKLQNMRVLGVDPAKKIALLATQDGIKTLPTFFTLPLAHKIKEQYGYATIITANNIFANIDAFDSFIKGVKKLLSPDGVFIIESFYLADLIKNKVFDFIFHEHISYFSVKPLLKFFKRYEMEIIDILHVPTKGGSLRYTVQLLGGPRKISPSVKRYISEENSIALQKETTFKSFSKSILETKKELQNFLHDLKKQKKTIAGYGASATSTTLMYHFDLHDTLSYLIDENPDKLHAYSPGSHIPVLPPKNIYKHYPDFILILAWRYSDSIIKNNQKYLDSGGHFIVPLPTFQVL